MAYTEQGTASVGEVYDEVKGNQQFMTELLGHAPCFFRTGTAWYDEVAVEIVRTLGLLPIGFDINADFGATASAKVAANAQKAKPGSILIGHSTVPSGPTFEGLKVAPGDARQGRPVCPHRGRLDRLIGGHEGAAGRRPAQSGATGGP